MAMETDRTLQTIYLALGCFWGAEEIYWQAPGVTETSVGYMGGQQASPTYEQVCTGVTGHTETVRVTYDPMQISTVEILRIFWENHDPTQGMRQGNDIGTQYRSAIFWTTPEQDGLAHATRDAYQATLRAQGLNDITTQIDPAADFTYYPAETYHQKYLLKNPFGYRCHAKTGVSLEFTEKDMPIHPAG
jgi:peptide-methionine (S)-S-oxide reductase